MGHRFGYAVNSVQGSVVLDMAQIPAGPGGSRVLTLNSYGDRSIDGTMRKTRLAAYNRPLSKWTWGLPVRPFRQWDTAGPIVRLLRKYAGPWWFFDYAMPNMLPESWRMGTMWTTTTGGALPGGVRASDGFATLAAGASATFGSTATSLRTAMIPVSPSTGYSFGITVYGVTPNVTATIAFYNATGTAASGTASAVLNTATAPTYPYLDGNLQSMRLVGSGTSPSTAVFAQLRVVNGGTTTLDIGDPSINPLTTDDYPSWYCVDIEQVGGADPMRGRFNLDDLQLNEI